MFTKKDLFWLVKEQYPNVQIGKSLADYKEAVAKVLGSKFELSDDIMTNNLQLKKFVMMFCAIISKLLKKFSKNYFVMVDSKNHQEFFGKEITVQLLTEEPNHKGTTDSKPMSLLNENSMNNCLKEKPKQSNIHKQNNLLMQDFIPTNDESIANEDLDFFSRFLFESTTEDKKLNNLDELTPFGKHFLVCCLHILLESDLAQDYEKAIHTWNWIRSNGKLKISMQTVFDMIQNWMYNQESEKENIHHDLKKETGFEPCETIPSNDENNFNEHLRNQSIETNEQSFVEPMIEATVGEKIRYGTRIIQSTKEKPKKKVNSDEVETNKMGREIVENWMCNPEYEKENINLDQIERSEFEHGETRLSQGDHNFNENLMHENIEINEQSCLTELAEVQPIDEKKYFLQTDKDSFPLQIGTQETDEMKKEHFDWVEEPMEKEDIIQIIEIEDFEKENKVIESSAVCTNRKSYEIVEAKIGDTQERNGITEDYFETVEELVTESTEMKKIRDGTKMMQSTGQVKSKKRKVDEVNTSKRYCKMSPDMIELMGKQCGKHSNMTMAKVLNLNVRNIQRQIKTGKITFSKHDGECHFCIYNEEVLNLSDGMIDTLKDQCKIHRSLTLIEHTGLNEIVVKRWLKEHASKFPINTFNIYRSNNQCELCKSIKKEAKCPNCPTSFENRELLNQHIDSVHDGKKPFPCKICQATFFSESGLENHKERKHNPNYKGEKKIECHLCQKFCTNLNYHMKKFHIKQQELLCSKCPAKFYAKYSLKKHFEAVHEGKKLHKCKLCDMSFAHKHDLKRHVLAVHEGKKPHLCPTCGISFADKGNLTKHVAAVHNGIKRKMKNKQ